MNDNNEPRPNENPGDAPDSSEVRDPQALIVAAAAFAGGLVGAIVGGMMS
ncbi:MAG: hypothetical protein AAGD86_07415 [Pseudomonadota bacterium]